MCRYRKTASLFHTQCVSSFPYSICDKILEYRIVTLSPTQSVTVDSRFEVAEIIDILMEFPNMYIFGALLLVVILCTTTNAKKITEANEDNCEVCVKFLTKFIDGLESDVKSSPPKIEDAIRKLCKSTKKDDNRFCYYIGGLVESATGMLGEISKPISWGMPATKVCMKLFRQDEQICDLRYDKAFDFTNIDLKKLKVKDLKKILEDWDTTCKGCAEKSEFIELIEALMPKYAPEAAAKRKAARDDL